MSVSYCRHSTCENAESGAKSCFFLFMNVQCILSKLKQSFLPVFLLSIYQFPPCFQILIERKPSKVHDQPHHCDQWNAYLASIMIVTVNSDSVIHSNLFMTPHNCCMVFNRKNYGILENTYLFMKQLKQTPCLSIDNNAFIIHRKKTDFAPDSRSVLAPYEIP